MLKRLLLIISLSFLLFGCNIKGDDSQNSISVSEIKDSNAIIYPSSKEETINILIDFYTRMNNSFEDLLQKSEDIIPETSKEEGERVIYTSGKKTFFEKKYSNENINYNESEENIDLFYDYTGPYYADEWKLYDIYKDKRVVNNVFSDFVLNMNDSTDKYYINGEMIENFTINREIHVKGILNTKMNIERIIDLSWGLSIKRDSDGMGGKFLLNIKDNEKQIDILSYNIESTYDSFRKYEVVVEIYNDGNEMINSYVFDDFKIKDFYINKKNSILINQN